MLPPVTRQTFVYSATLTLPSQQQQQSRSKRKRQLPVDGAIAEILEKAHAKGRTKIVDLTQAGSERKARVRSVTVAGEDNNGDVPAQLRQQSKTAAAAPSSSSAFRLPDGLQLQQIKCTKLHKDSHLYAYLMTAASRDNNNNKGPCLVFCNSIAGVRRVGTTLQTLGLSVRMLHAQMQQVRTVYRVQERNGGVTTRKREP